MFSMTKEIYRRRVAVIFTIGVVVGVLLIIGLNLSNNWGRDAKASESGITVLIEEDRPVVVPKGAIISGDAYEIKNIGDRFTSNKLDTPYVATSKMTIKCGRERDSICVIYLPDEFGFNTYHENVKKILLK